MSIYRGAGGASDATDDATVNAVAGYASDAAASATSAATSATNAATSASAANISVTSAATSASQAATSATNALSSANQANGFRLATIQQAQAAIASANAAAASASNASTSATSANSSMLGAYEYTLDAFAANSSANGHASAAAASAASALAIYGNTTAMNAAVTASQTAATNAATSASSSATSAAEALVYKDDAAGFASDANTAYLAASDEADIATEQANVAVSAANSALAIYGNTTLMNAAVGAAQAAAEAASDSSVTATDQANIATTQASNASTSATQAAASAAGATAIVTGVASTRPSIRPSLLLDFANTRVLDPRITFTRASTATFYDNDTSAIAEQNLLLQSQAFDSASWGKGASVTLTANAATAPDGTTTADLMSTAAGTDSSAYRISQIAQGGVGDCVVSIYLRASTDQTVRLKLSSTNATVITTTLDVAVTSTWTRFTVSGSVAAVNAGLVIGPAGVALSNIEIWGAQLEQRATVTAYTPTTTAAITNYIPVMQTAASGVARFDCNPVTRESLGLLIEESRTNLVTYSEQFDHAIWLRPTATIVANTIVAPDGNQTADKLNGNYVARGTFAISSSTTYTQSVYVKKAENTSVGFITNTSGTFTGIQVDLNTGAITQHLTMGFPTSYSAIPVGNDWWRIITTITSGSSTTSASVCYINNVLPTTTTGVYIWGAQIEVGAFATSYIPTVASQVTRAADAASMTGTAFSSWYNNAEGTLYGEWATPSSAVSRVLVDVEGATTSDRIEIGINTSDVLNPRTIVNGAAAAGITAGTYVTGTRARLAFGYKPGAYASSLNGVAVVTNSSNASVPVISRLTIGSLSSGANPIRGTINKIAYYPIRLSNTELQGLTA